MKVLKILGVIVGYVVLWVCFLVTVGGIMHMYAHEAGHYFPKQAEQIHNTFVGLQAIVSFILSHLTMNWIIKRFF